MRGRPPVAVVRRVPGMTKATRQRLVAWLRDQARLVARGYYPQYSERFVARFHL